MKCFEGENHFRANRERFSQAIEEENFWKFMDHWPLYTGVHTLARFLAIYELLKETISVPGNIAEFGAFRGTNTMFMAKVMHILDPLGSKKVMMFENFAGLETFSDQDGPAIEERGRFRGSEQEFREVISLFGYENYIDVIKGDIVETVPRLIDEDDSLSFSLVYIDVDLYQPTKVILGNVVNRLMPGSLLVFDEWGFAQYPGESVAVREFLSEYGGLFETFHVKNARQPTLVLKHK